MRRVPKGLVRLGCTALQVVAVLALSLAGCGDPALPTPSSPPPSPSSTISPASTGGDSDGLTVRYLDDDGTVKTVPVEDFPR